MIGLCGGSGSGKGTVAELLALYGIPSIDTDALYHAMTAGRSPCLDALVDEFGSDILNEDGALNRTVLAEIVFSGEDADFKRATLNKISHNFVLAETRKIISDLEHKGIKFVLVDAPLLFESGFNEFCDFIIAVTADEKVRINRIMQRDNISENKASLRIKSQIPDQYLIERSDFQIINNGSYDELAFAVSSLAEKILNIKEN